MIYNQPIAYNSNVTYSGVLVINAPSISSPIIVNNVTFFYPTNEDFSNLTTIAVVSIDTSIDGIITVQALDDQVTALASASVIAISGTAEITIVA
jgi:hypothetical protein